MHCERDRHMFGSGVMALYEDSKGTLWLGSRNGLCRWKPGSPQFFSIPEDPFGVTGFTEDEQGQLLFGSYAGIRRLVDGRVEPYPSSGSPYSWHVIRMFRDHDGGLWLGTSEQGLVHIPERGKTDVFSHTDGLSGDYVTRFLEDREGSIWVATYDGIDRFREYAVPSISTKQGLSSAVALSVLASKDGSVWIGTTGGLNHWKNGQISLFDSTHSGANWNREAIQSLFEDSRGRIWVSTPGGLGYLQNDRFISVPGVRAALCIRWLKPHWDTYGSLRRMQGSFTGLRDVYCNKSPGLDSVARNSPKLWLPILCRVACGWVFIGGCCLLYG